MSLQQCYALSSLFAILQTTAPPPSPTPPGTPPLAFLQHIRRPLRKNNKTPQNKGVFAKTCKNHTENKQKNKPKDFKNYRCKSTRIRVEFNYVIIRYVLNILACYVLRTLSVMS